MTETPAHIIRVLSTLDDISREQWDGIANPGWTLGEGGHLEPDTQDLEAACEAGKSPDRGDAGHLDAIESSCEETESDFEQTAFNPFVSHDFLRSLEESGCATAQTGWLAQHIVLEDTQGKPLAAAPCYLKNHSQGEYVFDYGWADAFERAGGNYYPKLQVSVPFTPATGRRLLVGPGIDLDTGRAVLAEGLERLCEQLGTSSVHTTFVTAPEARFLECADYLVRTDRQFHWTNEGYGTFEDFLSSLASRKRKAVRRERREATSDEITVEWLSGRDISQAHWDAFYGFYMDTGARKWGRPYLNRKFFSMLGERLGERVLLIMAKRSGRYIAGALNMIGSHTLYGRYWGCNEDHPFLHFELCYHQAIGYAIEHGLKRVEAGAQGAHKLARGYLPETTYSAHWIAHRGFRRAVEEYLVQERRAVENEQKLLREHAPYRRG